MQLKPIKKKIESLYFALLDPEQIKNALGAFQFYGALPGGTEWVSIDTNGLVPTEEVADEVLDYLRYQFEGSLHYAGIKPLDCMHGKIFFRKIAQLELVAEEEERARCGISEILGVEPKDILRLIYEWR